MKRLCWLRPYGLTALQALANALAGMPVMQAAELRRKGVSSYVRRMGATSSHRRVNPLINQSPRPL